MLYVTVQGGRLFTWPLVHFSQPLPSTG